MVPLFLLFLSPIDMVIKTYIDFHTNPSNHFFLHSNENPTFVIVYPSLDGKNYHNLGKTMKLALKCKNKLKFMDGALQEPAIGA